MLRTQNYPKNKSTRWFNVGVFMGILMSLFICNPLLSTWWSGKTRLQDSNHQFVSVPAGISDWTNQENTCQTSNTKSYKIQNDSWHTFENWTQTNDKTMTFCQTKITKTDDKCAILLKLGWHTYCHCHLCSQASSLLFLLKPGRISQIRWPVVACPTWPSWRIGGYGRRSLNQRRGLLGPPGCVRLHFLNVCFFFPRKEKSTTVVVGFSSRIQGDYSFGFNGLWLRRGPMKHHQKAISAWVKLVVGSPAHLKNMCNLKLDHETTSFEVRINNLWSFTTQSSNSPPQKEILLTVGKVLFITLVG